MRTGLPRSTVHDTRQSCTVLASANGNAREPNGNRTVQRSVQRIRCARPVRPPCRECTVHPATYTRRSGSSRGVLARGATCSMPTLAPRA
eukprot:5390268-Prymnesium_polylepis.2